MRPIIGLILDEALKPPQDGSAFSRLPYYALRMNYFTAIAAAGGAPIAIPYVPEALPDYLRVCDGWLIPGGDYRFRPDWYAAPPPVDLTAPSLRRDFEITAASQILAADRPVLGVCNGMQVMAAASGGKIAYHGPGPRPGGAIAHGDPAGGYARHDVSIRPGTRLAALLGAGARAVHSAHKEDVARLGPKAAVAAAAADGVIEALELPGLRFALGVQWHPEFDVDAAPLFAGLVAAAKGR